MVRAPATNETSTPSSRDMSAATLSSSAKPMAVQPIGSGASTGASTSW